MINCTLSLTHTIVGWFLDETLDFRVILECTKSLGAFRMEWIYYVCNKDRNFGGNGQNALNWFVSPQNSYVEALILCGTALEIEFLLLLFSCSVKSDSLQPHAYHNSLSFTISWSLLKLMSTESVMPSNHLILCCPLLLLPSIFCSIRVFSNESALCIRRSRIGASVSASVFQMNIQAWFPLGLTIIVQGALKSSLTPQFKSINSLALSLLNGKTLIFVHDYWKNHGFNYMKHCQQSDVSAFYYTV